MMDPGALLTNGAGEPASLDLAETRITNGPPTTEQGSAYGGADSLFWRYDDGRVFEIRDLRTRDFAEMLRMDGKAKTLEQVLTLPLRASEYSIEPADGDSGEAAFVREALERPANAGGMTTPLELVIGQMTSAVVFRRSYFEKVFRIDGSRVNYAKIAFRPATTCYLLRDKTDYSFKGFRQTFIRDDKQKVVDIGPEKAFVYIHGQHRDPMFGISDLETARVAFESKQKIRFLWYSFLENQTIPKAIAKSSTGEPQKLMNKVASLKGGGVIGVEKDDEVLPFESSGDGAAIFKQAMDYLDAEMSGSVLAGFTDLTSAASTSGVGSRALSEDQTAFFKMAQGAKLKEMASALTSWVLADLVRYNFPTGAAVPRFVFKPPAPEAVEQAFTMLQALATATQPLQIPHEFIDLLTEKVAGYLGINPDEVRTAIEKRTEQAPQTPVGQTAAQIAAAEAMVRAAQGAGAAPPAKPANLSVTELASQGGHHVPGTPYHYRHGWEAIVEDAAKGKVPESNYTLDERDKILAGSISHRLKDKSPRDRERAADDIMDQLASEARRPDMTIAALHALYLRSSMDDAAYRRYRKVLRMVTKGGAA